MQECDLIIVGGGMVGAAIALGLADTGLDICVVERQLPPEFSPEQGPDIRVSAFSAASHKMLAAYGAWERIAQTRLCPYRRLEVWEQENSRTRFNAQDSGFECLGYIIENRLVQNGLLNALSEHKNIRVVESGIQQLQFEPNRVQLENGQSLSAPLMVAADGAGSTTRQQAGIGTTGWQYQQHAMAISIKTHGPQQDITWQQFTPTGPVAFLPLYDGHGSLVWYHQANDVKALKKLTPAQLKQQILAHFPDELADFDILETASFPLNRMHANEYYRQGLVLVGDAAHQINPLAGQGVNLGFKDVQALVAEVRAGLSQGKALDDISILEAYSKQRRQDNLLMMSAMDGFYHLFSNQLGPLQHLRNLGLRLAERSPLKDQVMKYAMGLR